MRCCRQRLKAFKNYSSTSRLTYLLFMTLLDFYYDVDTVASE